MDFVEQSCEDFVAVLATKEPVPGGGGASALVGAIGMALGNMVGSLTVGKKKYAGVQEEIVRLQSRADALQEQLLALVTRDAQVFEPLSRAYSLPKDTEEQRAEKARVLEAALQEACSVPMEIMEKCCTAIQLHREFEQIGAAIAISDVGVGVACCQAALLGASLNVFINTKLMGDRSTAEKLNQKADRMLKKYTALADAIYHDVEMRLR